MQLLRSTTSALDILSPHRRWRMRPLNPHRRNRQPIQIPPQPQPIRQPIPPSTNIRRPQRPEMLMPIPCLRTILMILINAHPIIISPQPLLAQPLLPHFWFAPLLRTADFELVVLVLCFKLLDAVTAVDVVEAEFEDAVVEDAAFADVCSAAARGGEVVAVVQPELFLSCGGVLTWC